MNRAARGGDHRGVHARPAGLGRLREAIGSGLAETSVRTPLAAFAAALLLIVGSVAIALLVSGRSAGGDQGSVTDAAPRAAAGTSAAMPTASPRPRVTVVPSASDPTPGPASPASAASRAVSRTSPARSATSSPSATSAPSHCPPGLARHHRC